MSPHGELSVDPALAKYLDRELQTTRNSSFIQRFRRHGRHRIVETVQALDVDDLVHRFEDVGEAALV